MKNPISRSYLVVMEMTKLPIMNKLMSVALHTNTDELVKVLSRYAYPSFNQKPPAGGWTPGEIAEHLLLFDIRVNTVLSSKTAPVDRDPQEKINAFQERLADRQKKIDAPHFLVPSDVAKDPAALIGKIVAERRKLNQAILDTDLTLMFPDTPHRLFGVLTGIEWVQLGHQRFGFNPEHHHTAYGRDQRGFLPLPYINGMCM